MYQSRRAPPKISTPSLPGSWVFSFSSCADLPFSKSSNPSAWDKLKKNTKPGHSKNSSKISLITTSISTISKRTKILLTIPPTKQIQNRKKKPNSTEFIASQD